MSDTVFILGAGASKDAGAPIMGEFLDKAEELYKTRKVGKFNTDFELVFKAVSKLQQVHSKSQMDLNNIESVFAAFEMGKLIGKLPDMDSTEMERLQIAARRLIMVTLEKTMIYQHISGRIQPNSTYGSLAMLIEKLNREKQNTCAIITFNYDLAVDYALYFNNHRFDYCLSGVPNPSCTPLIKLHGSLNWTRCPQCKEIIPLTADDSFTFTHPFVENNIRHLETTSKLSSCGLKHCDVDVEPEPFMVPPTWNKTEHHQNISNVWKAAATVLSDAENIFVCGYSLPESDMFFRYLFALGLIGQARIKHFIVYNPSYDVQNRFDNLTSINIKNRYSFRASSFAMAIRSIAEEFNINI